jgi:hypothetical protein
MKDVYMSTKVVDDYKKLVLSVALLAALVSVILTSCVFQISHAQTTPLTSPAIKTFRIEAQLQKSVISRGDTQEIRYAVVDQNTRQPVGGAFTRATIVYPAGTPVKEFNTVTDSSGRSTISWTIEDDAPVGSYTVKFDVFQQGYAEESFASNFSVTVHNVDTHHNTNHNHHNHHHN